MINLRIHSMKSRRFALDVPFVTILLVALYLPRPVVAAQTRCGWIENDMPSSLTLSDREGTWTIASIDTQASGFDHMPDTDKGDSCGCLSVETDKTTMTITKLLGGKLKPVSACQKDKSLKQ
ncbi:MULTISPECIES: DUF4087 domain-containing protein [Paraburkholderia]|uniref:DUF4087 domain-containing protein n=1 Tax=Paraburkholderia TaxID=1822464 RepID=UPI00036F5D1E|nr:MULTISPECIES: DUF4087 domain-containing protein [Paraburkholderia]MDH6147282.1 hypothetical protein [Paraburkholderia sp. WSM4179]